MDAEERLGSRRDFGVVQEYERLDQLADIGGADEARDRPVPATAGRERNSASADADRRFGGILDVEAKAWGGRLLLQLSYSFPSPQEIDVNKIGVDRNI